MLPEREIQEMFYYLVGVLSNISISVSIIFYPFGHLISLSKTIKRLEIKTIRVLFIPNLKSSTQNLFIQVLSKAPKNDYINNKFK